MFKFNNNTIQVQQQGINKILLIAKDDLILIGLENGKEGKVVSCNKESYIDCGDQDLVHLYLKFKKISLQINNSKK